MATLLRHTRTHLSLSCRPAYCRSPGARCSYASPLVGRRTRTWPGTGTRRPSPPRSGVHTEPRLLLALRARCADAGVHALTCLLVERRLAIGMPYGKALDHPAVSHQDRRRAARGQRHCRCDAECMTAADDGGKEQNAHRGRRFAHSPSSITPRGCSSVPLGAHGRSKRKRGTAGIDLDHGQRCSRPWASN